MGNKEKNKYIEFLNGVKGNKPWYLIIIYEYYENSGKYFKHKLFVNENTYIKLKEVYNLGNDKLD